MKQNEINSENRRKKNDIYIRQYETINKFCVTLSSIFVQYCEKINKI
jgi:hypothetical protein